MAGSDTKESHSSSSSNTQSNRSTGSGTTSTPTVQRAQSTAAPSVAPVIRAGSDTQDTRGADTQGTRGGGSANVANSGIDAAAQTGNRGNQQLDYDLVDRSPESAQSNWLQLQDTLDNMSNQNRNGVDYVASRSTTGPGEYTQPGDRTSLQDFLMGIQNGSLGVPRARGYGLTYNPDQVLGMDNPMAQDPKVATKALEQSAPAQPFDFAALLHSLNGPYLARQAANGGVAPFDGPIDTAGLTRQLNAPYYRANATPGPLDEAGTGPSLADLGDLLHPADNPGGWASERSAMMATGDRLPSTRRVPTSVVVPAYADPSVGVTRDLNPDGTYSAPLQAITAATNPSNDVFTSDGQVTTADGTLVRPGVPAQSRGIDAAAPVAAKPSTWDKVVDNTGKLLSHTGLGSIVSGLFPDAWNGMGDAFKGLGNGGSGSGTTPIYDPASDTEIADRTHSGQTGGASILDLLNPAGSGAPAQTVASAVPAAAQGFTDVNHNGIDDRFEGLSGAASTNVYDRYGDVVFPNMPPYNPGIDDEWTYFRKHGYADGGTIAADPRMQLIGDAEDALQHLDAGQKSDADVATLTEFAKTYGQNALKKLAQNVVAGHTLRGGKGRMVRGPGGPKDDAVPAVIDGKTPVALSSGEFVMSKGAVDGAGGPSQMQALHDMLAAQSKGA